MAGDAHRHLERLLVVEARIDAALVRALEVSLGEPARAAASPPARTIVFEYWNVSPNVVVGFVVRIHSSVFSAVRPR